MNLRQAILHVRQAIGEITPRFWSDVEIIKHLNDGALEMCSKAHCLATVVKFDSVADQQEYPLPRDTDEVISVLFQQGVQLRERNIDELLAKTGSFVSGTPTCYYLRNGTQVSANPDSDASITIARLPGLIGRAPKKVLGLWPVPRASGNDITVAFYQYHYWMQQELDECAIPDPYQKYWLAYAIAECKLKEGSLTEYASHRDIFARGVEELLQKQANGGQVGECPRWRTRDADPDDMGSSWIYVGRVDG